ncbi:MAG: PLP-dependent transferase, partial [Allobranchiibius sp.]
LETLDLRVRAATSSALELAQWLQSQPQIASVRYPYLPSHPQYDLARRQQDGGGTVVTFTLASGNDPADAKAAAFALLDNLAIVDISNNLGDTKSLITHPATTTHRKLGPAGRARVGIGEATVRFSVGLEHVEDLRDDLAAALAHV